MKILIIEDDNLTAKALAAVLTDQNYAVELASDGDAGWDLIEAYAYDLILLDVVLPKLDGISLCRKLRSHNFQMPVLLLTGKDTGHDKAIGLDAGADDYVVKPFDPEELVARIRALLRRSGAIASPLLTWNELQVDPSNYKVSYAEKPLLLTPKEFALLELFLRHPQRVFSCGMILEHLWSYAEMPGEEAVRTHIKGLRQKLKAAGAPGDLVETVYGIGYRLKAAESVTAKPDRPLEAADQPTSAQKIQQQTLSAIAGIWQQYQPRVQEQVNVLEQAATALVQQSLQPELQQSALKEAHTLAGSLGTFGFPKASQIARKIEHLLQDSTTKAAQKLPQLVANLRRELDQPDPAASLSGSTQPDLAHSSAGQRPLLLVVDGDRASVEPILEEASNWGLRALIVADGTEARIAIDQEVPSVVLLDLAVPDGMTLLQELNQQTSSLPVLVSTAQHRLDDRLEVARLGAWMFLEKHTPTKQVLEAVTQALQRGELPKTRVLAVDDDPKVLATLRSLLEPWGLHLTTLEDSRQFWETLEAAMPDLLILDVKMPHVSGIDLCQVVRNDARWGGLPILFLTAQTETTVVNQVFAAGADDFVSKPIVGPELITRVIHRLERIRLLRRLADTDPLTGVFNRHKSTQMLESLLRFAQDQQQPVTFAIVDLNRLRLINNEHGYATGDVVLHQLGHLLRRSFQDRDVVARWSGEEFVIGMYGLTKSEGMRKLNQVLQVFQQETFHASDSEQIFSSSFHLTFQSGVAQYPIDGTALQQLYRVADLALAKTKSQSSPVFAKSES